VLTKLIKELYRDSIEPIKLGLRPDIKTVIIRAIKTIKGCEIV
jgi:hypothetical protein